MNLLGIDVGTTGLKAVLFDSVSGNELGSGYVEYPLLTPGPALVEIDPETWFSALKNAVRTAMTQADTSECAALAISSQGESFVLLDADGNVLRNAIVWMDSRSTAECAEIEKHFGRENLYRITGDPTVDPVWLGTKLLYLQKHEPEVWKQCAKIMLAEDYLIYRLTGQFRGNGALWCSTLLYDINKLDYFDDMLKYLGVSRNQLPEQIPSGRAIAPVKADIAAEIGFTSDVIAVSGGMDQACSALGSGNISDGIATDNTGTSFNLAASCKNAVFDQIEV
jgi:xylulokinase